MIHGKIFMKIIALVVIITFILQGDLFLYSKGEDGLDVLFNKARNEYNNGQYVTSKKRLEGIVGEIKENVLDEKEILGKCYLLLGAIYEKEEKTNLARENYRKAIKDYKAQAIDGVDFIGLIILEKVIKEMTEGPIKEEGEIDKKFNKARDEYVDGKYDNLKERLEIIIGFIKETGSDRVDILGMCYLLLGAVYEKEKLELLAEENYRKAKEDYDIQSIDGVDLENLAIYKKIITGVKGRIEKEGKKLKKKFPWLLVAGGAVIVVTAAILLLKKKTYTLTVTKSEGVVGEPVSGTRHIKKGKYINYSYTVQSGYTNFVVTLDGKVVEPSGSIKMDRDHTLIANADRGYTLTVEKGTGVAGTPESGTTTYAQGSTVDYSYRLQSGYSNLVVILDDVEVPSTGTITMNDNHTLRAAADTNVVEFVTDKDEVSIVEGNTSTFGVRLSTQPQGDVSVTVNRVGGDDDIRVLSGGNLTFSTSNWNQYKTVTLEALEDDDSKNDAATIRIQASGIDPLEITAVEVDNDSLNFVTDKDELSIDEGDTNTFQVKLSSQPSSDVAASISWVSGDSDIIVSPESKSLIFTPSNWNTNQTVTLEAEEDNDAENGEATIRISAFGIPDKEIIATENDNESERVNFVTNTNEVSVPEGDTAIFQVKLSSQPSSDVTASISRESGDSDISVSSGANPTFTTSNWNTYQKVTLRAGDDPDTTNGQATIRISAPGTGIPDKDITAAEVDNDILNFVTDKDEVSVPEGRTATFQVKLTAKPASNVVTNVIFINRKSSVNSRTGISPGSSSDIVAKVERESGDKDISVTAGSSLTFTTSNWDTYQPVTLQAAQDNDTKNGKATIRISASGIPNKDITATEVDNDSLKFVTDKDEVSIDEASTNTIQVRLSAKPSSNVTASISRESGDSDISVSPLSTSLTFTPSNWNTYQTVTLAAAEDDDAEDGVATIRISAPGIPDKEITATENDSDSSFVTEPGEVSVPEGGTATFQVKLSKDPESSVAATISRVSGDNDISVIAGANLNFDSTNWNDYQTVTLEAVEDDDAEDGVATIRISAPGIPDKDITATENDSDSSFVTEPGEVSVPEGGTATFQVKLSKDPESSVAATISRVSGDNDISVIAGANLNFDSTNWDTYQTVTLEAAEDDDDENGEAIIRISAPETEIQDKDITAKEIENDTSFVTDINEVLIDEGNTNTFQVKLSQKPTSDVPASISWVSGDNDISVSSGASPTFTTSNWDTYQTVTLTAAEDDDVLNGQAIIGISTGTFGISDEQVTAAEVDNDTLNFETDTETVSIEEGSTKDFQVKLSAKPSSDVTASVIILSSSDSDISVISGSDLTFTPSNWNTYQTVTLKANEDDDNTVNGEATIRISASGIPDKDITVTENDNDSP